MRRLAIALALCAGCGAGLVDHSSVGDLSNGGCAADQHLCSGACVAETASSCGPSCVTCSTPQHATPSCASHACDYVCDAGWFRCAAGCCQADQIAAGGDTTCAIVAGSVRCWGANDSGQLGPAATGPQSAKAIEVPGTDGASAIAVGAQHACAVVGRQVFCWGANGAGQLGSAAGPSSATPLQVPGISDAGLVAAGGQHTCAATSAGVTCWGANDLEQLGNNGATPQGPVAVTGVGGAQSLTAGFNHTCAVDPSGVVCWGAGASGQLGSGSPTKSPPVRASTANNPAVVVAGNVHTCAISSSLQCWGSDLYGQLGDGNSGAGHDSASPRGVSNISNPVTAAAAGAQHSCAVSQRDGLMCWGLNASGQLGLGPTPPPDTTKPVVVSLASVLKLALGADHTCAIVQDGHTFCWGRNDRGQTATAPAGVAVTAPAPILDR